MTKPKHKEMPCYYNKFICCSRVGKNCDKCGHNPEEHKRRVIKIRSEMFGVDCVADQVEEISAAEVEEESAPRLDVVSVTRCKDCESWKLGDDHCMNPAGLCACGYGARNNYCIFGNPRGG